LIYKNVLFDLSDIYGSDSNPMYSGEG